MIAYEGNVMNLEHIIEKNAPRNRLALLVVMDIFLIGLSGFLALYIRYDFRFSNMDMEYVYHELRCRSEERRVGKEC